MKYRLAFSLLMSLLLSSLMSGWVSYVNLGLVEGFAGYWLNAFVLAWPAAAMISFLLGPEVQKLSKYFANKL
ncbi:hypothetical protein A9R01_03090 ['Osedax' symbiont bacterium Rs2_46_30_T18]|nr:hypothetical protein A9R01_03090 ['Osedax' symbiont bacterium Rs2_46_30_T18]